VLPLANVGNTHRDAALGARYPLPIHRHYCGEEIFVLEGVFSDEFGDYPVGHWVRSPHLSQRQPFNWEGCLILVKIGHLNVT